MQKNVATTGYPDSSQIQWPSHSHCHTVYKYREEWHQHWASSPSSTQRIRTIQYRLSTTGGQSLLSLWSAHSSCVLRTKQGPGLETEWSPVCSVNARKQRASFQLSNWCSGWFWRQHLYCVWYMLYFELITSPMPWLPIIKRRSSISLNCRKKGHCFLCSLAEFPKATGMLYYWVVGILGLNYYHHGTDSWEPYARKPLKAKA